MNDTPGAFGSWFDGKSAEGASKGITVFPPQMIKLQGPVVFLAGPIKGSARWQDEAIRYLERNAPWLNIASPRKSLDRGSDYTEHDYISQVDWESHYLRIAAKQGVVFFFFAKEETHYCERPFARTTRIEFGEWMARHELEGTQLVVGFEEGFDGDKYIRHRLQTLPGVPIGESLNEALEKVIVAAECTVVPTEVPVDWECYNWSRYDRMRCGSMRCPLKDQCTSKPVDPTEPDDVPRHNIDYCIVEVDPHSLVTVGDPFGVDGAEKMGGPFPVDPELRSGPEDDWHH